MHPLLTLTRKVLHAWNLLWLLILVPSVYSKNHLMLGYTYQTIEGGTFNDRLDEQLWVMYFKKSWNIFQVLDFKIILFAVIIIKLYFIITRMTKSETVRLLLNTQFNRSDGAQIKGLKFFIRSAVKTVGGLNYRRTTRALHADNPPKWVICSHLLICLYCSILAHVLNKV